MNTINIISHTKSAAKQIINTSNNTFYKNRTMEYFEPKPSLVLLAVIVGCIVRSF